MRIAVKLNAGFVAVVALVGIAGYLSEPGGGRVQAQFEHLSRHAFVEVVDAANMVSALDTCHRALWSVIPRDSEVAASENSSERFEGAKQEVTTALNDFGRSLEHARTSGKHFVLWAESLDQSHLGNRERQRLECLEQIKPALTEYRRLFREFFALAEHDPEAALDASQQRLLSHVQDHLLPLIHFYRTSAESDFSRGQRSAERATLNARRRRSLFITAVGLVALLLGGSLSHSLGKRLDRLKKVLVRVGEGDHDVRIPTSGKDEIAKLGEAFNRMVAELAEKTVSKSFTDSIIHSLREMLLVTDIDGKIRTVNPAVQEELGFSEGELMDHPLHMLVKPEGKRPMTIQHLADAADYGRGECCFLSRDGGEIPVYCSVSPLKDNNGQLQGYVCAALNIADRRAAEEKIRASLVEKELLLREIHHRVKNNLQVISSLLRLQMNEVADPDLAKHFQESQGRIRSMALIHEQLYRSNQLARIDFAEYLERLSTQIVGTFGMRETVQVRIESAALPLPLDLAIPCGMIVHELISNALKHGFPGDRTGTVEVVFHQEEAAYLLEVRDNGIGMPPGGAPRASGGLGMKVVDALVRQIRGHMDLRNNQDESEASTTIFRIRFPFSRHHSKNVVEGSEQARIPAI